MNNEMLKTKANDEKDNIINLEKDNEINKKKLHKTRMIAISSTVLSFLAHITGILLNQPIIIMIALLYLFVSVSICGIFQFKYMDIEDNINNEIKNKQELIKNYEKELNQKMESIPVDSYGHTIFQSNVTKVKSNSKNKQIKK